MRKRVGGCLTIAALLCPWGGGQAQNRPAVREDTPSSTVRFFYSSAKRNVLRSAEKMPEDGYAFRPAPDVRTFGQLIAHVADSQYLFCSSARNEPNPNGTNLGPGDRSEAIEKGKITKTELVGALKEMFAYCDPVFEKLDDSQWKDPVRILGNERQKGAPVMLTIVHLWEHYGNMVTYMRMKGVVPPSSESSQQPAPATGEAQLKPAAATLGDFAWMVGDWRGQLQGPRALVTEQYWAEPQAGVMMGMFRLSDPARDGKPLLLEFISFRETPEGVEMLLRHFDTALKPMEKELPLRLVLVESDGRRFVFENPAGNAPKRSIVTRVGETGYTGRSEIIRDTGEVALIETVWERVSARDRQAAPPPKKP